MTPIAIHFECLMSREVQQEIGCLPDKPEALRVMRLLAEYDELRDRHAMAEREREQARLCQSEAEHHYRNINHAYQQACDEIAALRANVRDFINHCANGDFYAAPVATGRKLLGDFVDENGMTVAGEIAAARAANARAAERIREEQQRTERMVAILRKWNRLCEMGLMDVTKEWVRPAIMELWELTDEALPAEPNQVPTEHTENTEGKPQ